MGFLGDAWSRRHGCRRICGSIAVCRLCGRRRLVGSCARPGKAVSLESHVSKARSQSECNEDQEDLSRASTSWLLFVFEQVVQISGMRGMRVYAKASAAPPRRRSISEPQKGRSTNRGPFFIALCSGWPLRDGTLRRGCSPFRLGRGCRRDSQQRRAALSAKAIPILIFVAATRAAHRFPLPIAYDILRLRCRPCRLQCIYERN